ncbi:MAG: hypothetical protein B6D53_03250 [Candidatus Omnitrophica bacterium 4484_49]|nr:MAG: hypothetical protein B6D53_03250 [Candidatus Omnitrophica bacterium 4484_49]
MVELIAVIIYLVIFLALAGFSSGYETGIISVPLSTIEAHRERHNSHQLWLIEKLRNPEKLVSVTLVITNFSLASAVLIFLYTCMKFFTRHSLAELLAIILLTPLSIILSEILPKSLFRSKPDLIFKTVFIFKPLYYLSIPLVYLFYYFPARVVDVLSGKPIRSRTIKTKEEIKSAITKGEEKGILEEHERAILYKVFELGKKQVKEIMIPVKKVTSLEKGSTVDQAYELFRGQNFSRLPIYDSEEEEFIGLVNYMDLLSIDYGKGKKVEEIMHPIIYVDDNTYLDDLLVLMLRNRAHLVGIRNSLGMCVGIVTLEDVLEEIVGEY